MNKAALLSALPAYRDEWIVITSRQTVRSIIREVVNAHHEFAPHYDMIAGYFDQGSTKNICEGLYHFCKENIRYKEESDDEQTTALPAGILTRGFGDCKHYAGVCGGLLDALNRRGKGIRWVYRFASYRLTSPSPHHVFVVAYDGQNEIWIDPTPGVAGRSPIWVEDKKVKPESMALLRNIGGVGEAEADFDIISDQQLIDVDEVLKDISLYDDTLSDGQYNDIAMLLNYGVIDELGAVNLVRMNELESTLAPDQYALIAAAYNSYLYTAQIGNIFGDIWRGVKVVSVSVPRNAFLSLVALNVFAYGLKIKRVLDRGGESAEKLLNLWYKLGGSKDALRQTAESGAKKKPLLAKKSTVAKLSGEPISTGAILASAAAIIAAVMPLVASLLKKNGDAGEFTAIDAAAAAEGYGSGNSIMDFIRQNPIPVLGIAAVIIYYVWQD